MMLRQGALASGTAWITAILDRDPLEEARVIADPAGTKGGTGMAVMEVELDRLADGADHSDAFEDDGKGHPTDRLDLLDVG